MFFIKQRGGGTKIAMTAYEKMHLEAMKKMYSDFEHLIWHGTASPSHPLPWFTPYIYKTETTPKFWII